VRYKKHNQVCREDDKKFFFRSVSIKEGETFSLHKRNNPEDSFIYNGEPIDFNEGASFINSRKSHHKHNKYFNNTHLIK